MIDINEIESKIQEVDNMFFGIANSARQYMRRIYSDFLRNKTSEALDNMRNVARAFNYVGIIDGEFCDRLIRQAEEKLDKLQEAAAPEVINED